MTSNREPPRSNKLSSDAWFQLQRVLVPLFKLSPPHELKVEYGLPEHANRIRDWLYQYFREMNYKALYRIRRLSPTQLAIQCRSVEMPIIHIEDNKSLEERFFEERLFGIEDLEKAREIVNDACEHGEITDHQLLSIMDLYRQVYGPVRASPGPVPDSIAPDDFLDQLDKPAKDPFDTIGESEAKDKSNETQ